MRKRTFFLGLFKREIGLQTQGVGRRKSWEHQQGGKGRQSPLSATIVHQLAHLLIVEIRMVEQGAESSMIDIKVPAQRARNAEPTVAMNQRAVDFIELLNTNKAAQFAAIIHNAACPVGTYARHTLQQGSVGCIEIEHSVGAELVTLPHCMLLPCAP